MAENIRGEMAEKFLREYPNPPVEDKRITRKRIKARSNIRKFLSKRLSYRSSRKSTRPTIHIKKTKETPYRSIFFK